MREPYETLLGHYRDDPILCGYLRGDEPDWYGLAALSERPQWHALGSGQHALIDFAAALKNVRYRCDGTTQMRVMVAMQLVAAGAEL